MLLDLVLILAYWGAVLALAVVVLGACAYLAGVVSVRRPVRP
jgi:hypothetical protein